MGGRLGRANQALNESQNQNFFEGALQQQTQQDQLAAQMMAAGRMEEKQQQMRANQAVPSQSSMMQTYQFNFGMASVCKWLSFLSIGLLIASFVTKRKLYFVASFFLLVSSLVFLLFIRGPFSQMYLYSSRPMIISPIVGLCGSVILMFVLPNNLFE